MEKIQNLIENHKFTKAQKEAEQYIKSYPQKLIGYELFSGILNQIETPETEISTYKFHFINDLSESNMPDSLVLQVKYIFQTSEPDSINKELADSIIIKYPHCQIANYSAQEKIFEIVVERNDSVRVVDLNKFIKKFPENKWTALAWKYLLYSYKEIGEKSKLDSVLNKVKKEYPHSPKMINLVASYYAKSGIELEYYMNELEKIIAQIDSSHQNEYFNFFTNKSKDELLIDYYFTLSNILYKEEQYEKVHDLARKIGDLKLSTRLLFIFGKAEYALDNKARAFTFLLDAVVKGDERNHWTPKADSLLQKIYLEFSENGDEFREFACLWGNYRYGDFYQPPLFIDITAEAGLSEYKKARIAWGDYNNDGFDDLLLNGNVLLKNNTDGTFSDVSKISGLDKGKTNGGVWADFDRDGFLDIFSTSSNSNKDDILWKNIGEGSFLDITIDTPLADTLQTEGAAWGDFNSDLYPDLCVANYEKWGKIDGEQDFLYLNKKGGYFEDVTTQQKIIPPFGENQAGRGVNWGDFNNDGFLDIFVSNYRLDKNFLWQNYKGKFFSNVAKEIGVEGKYTDGWYGHTIGSEWGDFDNDGDLDLICANLAHPRYIDFSDMTMLYENKIKEKRFYNIRENAGISYDECHSDPSWCDVNGDGFLDLFITSIYPNRRSYLYLNNGDKTFTDITYFSGVRTFNSWGAAFSDFDNDGDPDLLVCSNDGIHLFRNDTEIANWLKIQVLYPNGKTPIIGTRVEVGQNELTQIREIEGGKGTTSQHSQTQFFGFPSKHNVDIKIRFLDGKIIRLSNEEINRTVKIVY
ncbi:MAG: CRTAC1 family protein [Candidatus Cloacimonadota bacterium]|nr:CRTAC1 family protein [Candidatus Cloacimonadota bacterium]